MIQNSSIYYVYNTNQIKFIIVSQDVVNGTNGGLEKGDSEKNGSGEKWRNSYVPYEEEYNNQ